MSEAQREERTAPAEAAAIATILPRCFAARPMYRGAAGDAREFSWADWHTLEVPANAPGVEALLLI